MSISVDRLSSIPYRAKFTRPYLCSLLLFRYLPYYIHHYVSQRYRRDIPAIGYVLPRLYKWQWRWHGAMYDTMYNILLDGYTELTGLKVIPATGQMLFFLIELTRCLDKHLDSLLGNNDNPSLALEEILEIPALKEQLTIFRCYVEQFGRAEPIFVYLKGLFTEHYERHILNLKTARQSGQFEDILTVAHIDNGGWLRVVMEVVRLFNAHELESTVLDDYYLLGMAGKFADDMADLLQDIDKGYLNLLYALLCQTPAELEVFQFAVRQKKLLDTSWWSKHCPTTYIRYFEYIDYYYNQLCSSKLRLACDVVMIIPVIGYDPDPAKAER